MASIDLQNIRKTFGKVEVVHDLSLAVRDRELLVFVGPSGCGKSTLLRMIAGLEEISSGELRIGGKAMNRVPAADRGIAMVFQSYALYPHMTVAENMGFALKMMGVGKAEMEDKVRAAARILQLEALLDRKPRQLSGGQRQRVAIGRAITRSPDVFLFDEPLSNLDADLRAQMRVEIARLHDELKTTMIYVTHDQIEAMTLADRIVILNNGRIEQEGAPLDLYQQPASRFVAGFLGQPRMNFVPVVSDGADLRLGAGGPVLVSRPLAAGKPLELGIRPDAIAIAETGIPAHIVLVERLGGSSLVHTRVEGLEPLLTIELPGTFEAATGTALKLAFDPSRAHVFDSAGHAV
ncbi:sn-glycerol-3-phosphate ABC transporter ATP-binding protein UgpC [Devosia sp. ZB163]|uniref:ABC transporter ATP-binding protein n=1 Tax=Devosia sp. ZB163 TaxID=3025938 RepID=UPI002362D281|nr:sn-glycerol-3-phosphate ABC transporter ATP-binding protein UgpC [Devosia sp. ZB163]MDC9825357.1 sn-glycerol-3-phosphate ABC transporter ATP-binding protein UgpC [Devosia sp. ZB163]